jgi:hypothetical protein
LPDSWYCRVFSLDSLPAACCSACGPASAPDGPARLPGCDVLAAFAGGCLVGLYLARIVLRAHMPVREPVRDADGQDDEEQSDK